MLSHKTKRIIDAMIWPLHPEEDTSDKHKDMAIEDILNTLGTDTPMLAKEIWYHMDNKEYDEIYYKLSNLTK